MGKKGSSTSRRDQSCWWPRRRTDTCLWWAAPGVFISFWISEEKNSHLSAGFHPTDSFFPSCWVLTSCLVFSRRLPDWTPDDGEAQESPELPVPQSHRCRPRSASANQTPPVFTAGSCFQLKKKRKKKLKIIDLFMFIYNIFEINTVAVWIFWFYKYRCV